MSNQMPPHPEQPASGQPQGWPYPQAPSNPQGWPNPQAHPGQPGASGHGQTQPPRTNASGPGAARSNGTWDPTQPFPTPGSTGGPGRDPRAPMGAPIPAAVDIEQFQQKRSRTPLVATLVVLALVVVGVVLGTRAMQGPATAPASTPRPSITITPQSTAGNNALSVPFDNDIDQATGTWSITDHQWSGDRLTVTLSVHADKGTQAMRFFAISNDSETRSYDPTASGRADDLLNKQVAAGTTTTGTVTFAMPHQTSTIFLTAANGHQVSALVVPA